MLTRFHKILGALLVLQLVLLVVLRMGSGAATLEPDRPVLAGFDPATVTRIQVFGAGSTKVDVDLVKKDTGWFVASAWDFPATTARITEALEPLKTMAAGTPTTSTAANYAQLKVSDTDFERKVIITAGGKDITLLMGSQRNRRTSIRVNGSADVLAASNLNAFAFAVAPRQWVETKYLDIPRDDVARVEITKGAETFVFERPAPAAAGSGSATPVPPPTEGWTALVNGAAVTPGPGEVLDTSQIEKLVGDATAFDLAQPADPNQKAAPAFTIIVERKGATTGAQPEETIDVAKVSDTQYWVHRRGDKTAILVDASQVSDLAALAKEKLVTKNEPAPPPGGGMQLPPGMELPPGMQLPEGMELPPGMMPQ